MTTAKLTTKGRVTIPAQVRTALGLVAGDVVEFVTLRDGSVELGAKNRSAHALKASFVKSRMQSPEALTVA
ncbi:AbrB/MazE/SpoVT family DNA-binding domain-containing protein [Pseudomonas sp. GB2N2]